MIIVIPKPGGSFESSELLAKSLTLCVLQLTISGCRKGRVVPNYSYKFRHNNYNRARRARRRRRPGNVEIRDQILIDPISFHRSQSCVSGRAGTWLGYLPGEHINQTSHRRSPRSLPQALKISARSSNPTCVIQSAKEPRERCCTSTTTDRRKSYHGVSLPVVGRAPAARLLGHHDFDSSKAQHHQ